MKLQLNPVKHRAFTYFGKYYLRYDRRIHGDQSICRQLCDLGFLSLLTTESSEPSSPLFQSDMIDHGLNNHQMFLNYIRKHVDRLMIRGGEKNLDE